MVLLTPRQTEIIGFRVSGFGFSGYGSRVPGFRDSGFALVDMDVDLLEVRARRHLNAPPPSGHLRWRLGSLRFGHEGSRFWVWDLKMRVLGFGFGI